MLKLFIESSLNIRFGVGASQAVQARRFKPEGSSQAGQDSRFKPGGSSQAHDLVIVIASNVYM